MNDFLDACVVLALTLCALALLDTNTRPDYWRMQEIRQETAHFATSSECAEMRLEGARKLLEEAKAIKAKWPNVPEEQWQKLKFAETVRTLEGVIKDAKEELKQKIE